MRRIIKLGWLIGLLVVLSGFGGIQAEDDVTIDDFAYMSGHWVAANGEDYEEGWFPPKGGIMSGMFRWPNAGGSGRYLLELLTIAEEADGIVFRFKYFDPEITASVEGEANTYELIDYKPNCATFELVTERTGVPEVVNYCSPDENTLLARVVKRGMPIAEADFVLTYKRLGT